MIGRQRAEVVDEDRTVISIAKRQSAELAQAAGLGLLVSIVFWWMALRAWAEANVGHLDVDALGVAPFVWIVLLAIAGLALVTRALPRPSNVAANVVCTVFFSIVTGALAAVNVAYGADDGISTAGWFVAAFSVAQASAFVAAMFLGSRRTPSTSRRDARSGSGSSA